MSMSGDGGGGGGGGGCVVGSESHRGAVVPQYVIRAWARHARNNPNASFGSTPERRDD